MSRTVTYTEPERKVLLRALTRAAATLLSEIRATQVQATAYQDRVRTQNSDSVLKDLNEQRDTLLHLIEELR